MVVGGIEIDLAEQIDCAGLSAPLDVPLQRLGDGRLFGLMPADSQGVIQEAVIDSQIGSHV